MSKPFGPENTKIRTKVRLKIGPVSATFSGSVDLTEVVAPSGCTIVGQGNGGVAGFAMGRSEVRLVEDGGDTVLTYLAKAEIGGKLAALGSRLVQATSRKLADEFFSAFVAGFPAAVRTPT